MTWTQHCRISDDNGQTDADATASLREEIVRSGISTFMPLIGPGWLRVDAETGEIEAAAARRGLRNLEVR